MIRIKNILFVCTGNTCRSSTAEALFNTAIQYDKKLSQEYAASSAGIYAFEGEPASPKAIEVMQKNWGIDLKRHEARKLSYEHAESAFLILTMTARHKNAVAGMFPELQKKVFTLKEYTKSDINTGIDTGNEDIADPFGGDYKDYEKCAKDLNEQIDILISILRRKMIIGNHLM